MTTQRNRLGCETETIEVLAGELNASSLAAPSDIDPLYESRLHGWAEGWESRQAEIDHLSWTADRLYIAMCARSPKPYIDRPSYAELERIRGNPEHADRIDAANVRRFAEVTS